MSATEGLPPIVPGRVSIVLTVLEDPRVARTLESLLSQDRLPDEIWVDDGGGSSRVRDIVAAFRSRDPRVRYLLAPGNVAESRNRALTAVQGEFIAFLDADEVAPPGWLRTLLTVFADPKVGFAGGPTPAELGSLRRAGARFYDGYLQRFYDVSVRAHPHSLPMGNSMWRARLFRELGPLVTFGGRAVGGEDLEFALRAVDAGWKGVYLPEARVDHDFSDVSLGWVLRKASRYAEGGFAVWRRHKRTSETSGVRLAPFIVPPVLAVVGALLLIPNSTRLAAEIVLALSAIAFVALAAVLTLQGVRQDRRYPGLRFQAFEILRRWATMWGAGRAWLGGRKRL
ncbi:MAG: glycosyltransferase [Thermoplasmata archaeon]